MSGEDRTGVYGELLGRGSLYTVATALQISSTVLVVPIVTRLLDPDAYGEIALALVVLQLGGIVAAVGIPGAITRLHFEGAEGPSRASGLVWLSALVAVVITTLLDVTGSRWIGILGLTEYSTVIRLAVWAIPFLVTARAAQSVFRARARPWRFVTVSGILSLGANGLGLILILGDPTAQTYLLGVLIGTAAAALAAVAMLRQRIALEGSSSRLALQIGAPTVAHGIALYALSAGDRVVIQAVLGLESVGRYQSAYLAGALGISLLVGLNNAWAPIIHGADAARRWEVLTSTTLVVVRVGALLAMGLALVAPIGMRVFVPASYGPDELADVVAVVAASSVAYAVYLAAVHILFQEKRTRSLAFVTPLTAAINLGLNFILIDRLGLIGAALATVLSYAILAGLMHLAARRLVALAWPWREIGLWAGSTGVVAWTSVTTPLSSAYLAIRVALAVALGVYLILVSRSLIGSDR